MNIAEEKLFALAKLFDKPIYLVGGAVRNRLMGLPVADYDTASANTPEEVAKRLRGSEFSVLAVYPRTGTALIGADGFKTEHTTFRTDSYPLNSGAHAPESVAFTDDINIDARRRDFSVNAIYFDLRSGEIVDPTGGMEDLRARVLRAADEPARVLGEDALRILRLARQRAELGLSIEERTFAAACRLGERVKDISRERITDEYLKLLRASQRYGVTSVGISDSMELLRSFNCYETVTGIDYLSEALPYLNGAMSIETILAGVYYREAGAEVLLKELKLPNAAIKEIAAGIAALNARGCALPDYIAEHYAGYLTVRELVDPEKRLIIDSIASAGVPVTVGGLKVRGEDVLRLGVSGTRVGETLKRLLKDCIAYMLRDRESQLAQLERIIKGDTNEHS